jgi:hypothetical protein
MRKSTKVRAAGLMLLPLTNSALISIDPKSQSGRM